MVPTIPLFSPIPRLYEPEATIPFFHWVSIGRYNPYGAQSKPETFELLNQPYRSSLTSWLIGTVRLGLNN